jgi:hypothetical protein
MAQGAQLCCSPACEKEARRRSGVRWFRSRQVMDEAVAFIVVLALLGWAIVLRW